MLFEKRKKITLHRIILYILGFHIVFTCGCGSSEYRSAAGECCPMCSIGHVVYRDCSGGSNTTCRPCESGAFMNQSNGFTRCFQCKICDKAKGHDNLLACTTTHNRVCGVLDGYYCKDRDENKECTFALKHRQCDPGEGIKVPGTKDSDTVCEECPQGFYSPLGINCTKWTDCSVKDEIKDTEGSSVKDVQCKVKTRERHALITAAAAGAAAAGAAAFLVLCTAVLYSVNSRRSAPYNTVNNTFVNVAALNRPVEETTQYSLNSPEENREEDFT